MIAELVNNALSPSLNEFVRVFLPFYNNFLHEILLSWNTLYNINPSLVIVIRRDETYDFRSR